jgi:hypothetical protein
MAIASPEDRLTTQVAPALQQPLLQLGRAIRAYVAAEGLGRAVLAGCLWLWIVLALDWGAFALFGVDYLRDAPAWLHGTVRGIFLAVLLAGLLVIVGYQVVYRVLRPFPAAALALVLERRFPQVLEDRLVTAVELADLSAVASMGYSPQMVELTARSAASQVERLALAQVFNWSRLRRVLGAAAGLVVSVLVVALFATDVFARFLERNLLLRPVYWPQPILLELPGFAETDVKAVPHGGDLRVWVRAWKFVVADRSAVEGWRLLQWSDLVSEEPGRLRPWELRGLEWPRELYLALPESWQALPLDDIELRVRHSGPDAAGETAWRDAELGNALVDFLRARLHTGSGDVRQRLGTHLVALLPESWQTLEPSELEEILRVCRLLKPAEADRLCSVLRGEALLPSDLVQLLLGALCPISPPLLPAGWTQRRVAEQDPVALAGLLPEKEQELLPRHWRSLPLPDLETKLRELATEHTPDKLGERVRARLLQLCDDLHQCAASRSIGRRRSFRVLRIPEEVAIEFQQLLSEQERAVFKPRVGKPRIRRQLGGHDYLYDFKNIDHPLRFRVLAEAVATAWRRIEVKELPVLIRLVRRQQELGYLHHSNERVPVGPVPISLQGDESQVEIPSGTLMEIEGSCQKPLRWVRVVLPGQTEHQLWAKCTGLALTGLGQQTGAGASLALAVAATAVMERSNPHVRWLEHRPPSSDFRFALHELGTEDLPLSLEFEDTDGIVAGRRLVLRVVPDREPEYRRVQPEIVRRKMITPQAVIPFSGHLHDDHGLLAASYEVTVQRMDRTVVQQRSFPLRQFRPLRLPDEWPDEGAFEKRSEVTLARLLGGNEVWWSRARLPLLPLAGPGVWATPPCLETVRDYVFDFQVRPGGEPVLSPTEEYFDTLLLRDSPNFAQPAESSPPPLAVPYRLTIRLTAVDNRVQSGPDGQPIPAGQPGRSPEAFDFVVVSEEELLIENNKREEDLRDRCEAIIANIRKGRMALLKRLRDDADADFKAGDRPYDFRRAAADVHDMHKLLLENRQALDQEVARGFRDIYRELVLNRCREQVTDRIDKRICRPLETLQLPGQHFERALASCSELARRLEAEGAAVPRFLLDEAIERTDQLLQRLEEILNEMRKLIEFNEAIKIYQEILSKEREILEQLRKKERQERLKELQDKD